jgi:acyl carrier protein
MNRRTLSIGLLTTISCAAHSGRAVEDGLSERIFMVVKNKIIEMLGPQSAKDVTLRARLIDDLGMDSLDMLELDMAFEVEFSVPMCTEKFVTVGDIVVYVRRVAPDWKGHQ